MKYLLLSVLMAVSMVSFHSCKDKQTTSPIPVKLQGSSRTDSLQSALLHAREDTNKIILLGHIAHEYRTVNPDTGIRYAGEALVLATKLSWKKGLAIANGNLGLNYKYKSDYPKALEYLLTALKYNEEVGFKKGMGSNFSNIGVIYQEQGNYTKALEFFQKSLKINIEIKDSINMAGDLGNIGILYNIHKDDYDSALAYELRSLKIFTNLQDKDGEAHNLGNIGDIYHKLGNYTRALEYEFAALKIFEELGDKNSVAINEGNIGEAYLKIAKSTNREPGNKNAPSASLTSAISYLAKSVQLSREIGDLENIIEFSRYLSDAYHFAGNDEAALASYKEYTTIKDSVYSIDSKLKIAALETQREIEVKDKQIELDQLEVAKRRNERILLIIVTALLLVIIVIGLRKYIQQKRSNKQLSKEKKSHLARIEAQTSVLSDIAYTQSHEVSGQVATILGLVNIFNFENTADPDNKVVIEGIAEVSAKLDKIVKEMIIKENDLNRSNDAFSDLQKKSTYRK